MPRASGTERLVTNTQYAKSQDSGVRPTESPRIRRGSSSMARPLRAALRRKRFFALSSRLRIVLLAVPQVAPSSQTLVRKGIDHQFHRFPRFSSSNHHTFVKRALLASRD